MSLPYITARRYPEVSIMCNLFKSLEWTQSLFELAWSLNPTWRTVFGLHLLIWSQLFPAGTCVGVRTYVLYVHCLLVFDYSPLWYYLSYCCPSTYVYSLVKYLELSVGVNLTSVLDSIHVIFVTLL